MTKLKFLFTQTQLNVKNNEEIAKEPEIASKEETRRSERKTKWQPAVRLGHLADTAKKIPENFKDLGEVGSQEKRKWLLASDEEEIDSLSHNKTWQLTDLSVGCWWTFKRKRNEDGTIGRI